ncbi:MAG: ATP-binding protein [Actinomycetia bacterium]|nr:ATP-binding protein [Actinomycetes bacterium]
MRYMPRVVDALLARRLKSSGAVVIEGAKACGKTETARQVAASSVPLDIDMAARDAIAVDPMLVLAGDTPRLLDEWQLEPAVSNLVRRVVDERQAAGQFILTGSAAPNDDINRHTGAGRFSFLHMRPMSIFESGRSSGGVSLNEVMSGADIRAADAGLSVADLAELVTRGGWPAQQSGPIDAARQSARDYLQQVQEVDIGRLTATRRDPVKVGRLLQSLARNVATEVAVTKLAAETGAGDAPLNRETVTAYLDALERLMVVENQPAWGPHLRSRAVLRTSPKRHFVDPSLAVAALAAGPERLLQDLNMLGLLFESLVIRDLRILSQPLDGTVSHYRDDSGLEVDAIVHLADGRWAAFEVKLGTGRIEEAAVTLTKFASVVDTDKIGEPASLAVVTGTGYAYIRDDGIAVIPIGTLAP